MALGLEIPERLVGLAETRQQEPERAPIIVDNVMPPCPGIDRLARVPNACAERARSIVNPKVLVRMMASGCYGQIDQVPDQASRHGPATVTDAEPLVFGALRPALQVDDLDRAT
jgi:hypothetical protein